MIKNKYFILAVLCLAFILVRLPIILTSMDKIFDVNELYVGTIAKELIEGPSLPLFDYQLTHIKGGTLLAGIFVVPFFWLFGQSYFVLKLAALLVSLMILAVTYLFLWRFFSKRIAVIAGTLMTISAPLYTLFSLTLYGREHESILFTMITLLFFYRILFQEASAHDTSHKGLYFALFGLISGLGMYSSYIFAVTLVHCFVFWFIFDKFFFVRRGFWLFLAFFFVGLSPWIYYNFTHKLAAICVTDDYAGVPLSHLFFSHSFPETARKLKDLLADLLPNSFYFRNFKSIPGDTISYFYYIIFLLSSSVLFWLNKKAIWNLLCGVIPWRRKHLSQNSLYREVFILLYPVSFSLLYSFSCHIANKKSVYNFFGYFEYRFLIILCPFVLIIIAIFLSRLWDWSKAGRRIATYLFVGISLFLITSGLCADYDLMTLRNFGKHLVYEGYNYDILGLVIGERYGLPISKAVSLAENMRPPYRASVFKGIGYNMGWRFFRGKEYADIDTCMIQVDKIDDKYRPFVLEGFGAFLELQLRNDIAGTVSYLNSIHKQYRPSVCRGIGWLIGLRFKDRFSLSIKMIDKINEEYRPGCYRGLGEITSMICGRDMSRYNELSRSVDPKYRPYVLEGFINKP